MIPATRKAAFGYLAGVFVLGGVAGGFAGVSFGGRTPGPPPKMDPRSMTEHICSKMEKELSLTPEQLGRVRPVVDSTAQEIEAIRQESMRRMDAVFHRNDERLSEILTPEQRATKAKLDEERRRRHGKPGPGPRGPGHEDSPPGPPPGHTHAPAPTPAP